MPTVPRYEPGQIDTRPVSGATLDVRRPLDNPLARGLGDVGQAIGAVQTDIYDRERRKQSQLFLQDADRQLGEFENTTLHDPQSGAFTVQGKDALGLRDKVLPEYDKVAGKLAGAATTDEQRIALERMVQGRRQAIDRSLEQHAAQQMKVYDAQTTEGSLLVSRDSVGANYTDPQRVSLEIAKQQAIIRDHAARTGMPPELVALKLSEATTESHALVIDRLLANDQDQAAASYYQANKEQIAGGSRAQIERTIQAGSRRSESRALADDIIRTSAKPGTEPDLLGALDELEKRGVKDVDVYDRTKDRLQAHFALRDQAQRAHDGQLVDNAKAVIDETNGDWQKAEQRIGEIPAKYKASLIGYAKAIRRGDAIETPFEVKYGLDQAARTDPVKFSQFDLRTLVGSLSKQDRERYSEMQAEIKKGSAKLLSGTRSMHDVINSRLLDAGMTPATNSAKMGADERQFREQLDSAVSADQQALGRELVPDEVGKIADRLLTQQVLARKRTNPIARFFDEINEDKYTHAFQSPISQRMAYSAAQIPPDAAETSRRALVAAGNPNPSDEAIRQHYNESLIEAYRDGQ